MSLTYLDVKVLEDTAKDLSDAVEQFNAGVKDIADVSQDLIGSWHGDAKNEFQKYYNEIYRHLSDVNDTMYDIYDALVEAAAAYTQCDEEIAKSFTMGEVSN